VVVLIDSQEFADQVLAYMETGIQPANSYRLALESDESEVERLVWITENDGEEVRYYSDPEVGTWRRFTTWLVSLLPIEDQL
jgi:putative cardiolipin synthase